jgi:putative FmdB family regulatory protein
MPIYEFRCPTCTRTFEARRGFADEPAANCPADNTPGQRLFSAPMLNVPSRTGDGGSGASLLGPEPGYGGATHHDHGGGGGHGHGHSHGPGTAPHRH